MNCPHLPPCPDVLERLRSLPAALDVVAGAVQAGAADILQVVAALAQVYEGAGAARALEAFELCGVVVVGANRRVTMTATGYRLRTEVEELLAGLESAAEGRALS